MWTCGCQHKEDLRLLIGSRYKCNLIHPGFGNCRLRILWPSHLTLLLLNQLFPDNFVIQKITFFFFPVRFRHNCFILSVFLNLMSQVYIFVLEIYLIVLAWKLWIFFFLTKTTIWLWKFFMTPIRWNGETMAFSIFKLLIFPYIILLGGSTEPRFKIVIS